MFNSGLSALGRWCEIAYVCVCVCVIKLRGFLHLHYGPGQTLLQHPAKKLRPPYSPTLSVSLCRSLFLPSIFVLFCFLSQICLSPSIHLLSLILCQYLSLASSSITHFAPSPPSPDPASPLLPFIVCSIPIGNCPLLSPSLSLTQHDSCYHHVGTSFTHHASRCDSGVG